MKVYIKNMVCLRCKMIVEDQLQNLGINYKSVEIGEINLPVALSYEQQEALDTNLRKFGLELINNRKTVIVEKVKNILVDLIHHSNRPLTIRLSDYLRQKMNYDYTYLANVFTEVEGRNIENYFISQKIEKVKELLKYEELTLTEIAYKLHYSSVAHLSFQFKKVTGLTPSEFRTKNERLLDLTEA